MINHRYEAWMNRIALSSLSPEIFITAIETAPAARRDNTYTVAGRDGSRIARTEWDDATVRIGFILKKSSPEKRQELIQAVYAWGREGVLETSDRPGRQLWAVCSQAPAVPDVCSWNRPIVMEFRSARKGPFWEDKNEAALTLEGVSDGGEPEMFTGSGKLYVPGNIGQALTEVTVTPDPDAAGLMMYLKVSVGETEMVLNNLWAQNAEPVRIFYDTDRILHITRGTVESLGTRTGESDDDLLAECGKKSTIRFEADRKATATFRARGLWL